MKLVKDEIMDNTDYVYRHVYRDEYTFGYRQTGIMNRVWVPVEDGLGFQHDRECIRAGWFLGMGKFE